MKKNTLTHLLSVLSLCLFFANCESPTSGGEKLPEVPLEPWLLGDAPRIFTCGQNSFVSDTFNLGRISSQNGWENDINEAFDEAIEDIGGDACRGRGVWRINNSHGSGGFSNQPLSPAFTKSNGEVPLRSAGGGDSMYYEFFFKTKSTSGDWTIVDMSFASAPTVDRLTDMRIRNLSDAHGGLQLELRDGLNLDNHILASNLTRGAWHHLKVVIETPDGFSNDIVKVYLNGTSVGTFTSWENFFEAQPAPSFAVSRVMFRVAHTFNIATGLYIDDFQQVSFDSSDPTTVIESYRTGFEN